MAFDRFDQVLLSQFIASEVSPGALWIFVHIPRTAGSSFATEFADLRPNHKYLRVDATEEQIPYAKKMNRAVEQFSRELETRAYKACSGHIKMAHVKRIRSVEPGAKVITLIRNPVDRVVSDFRHARTPAHPPHREFIQKYPSIQDYVDAPESQDKVARFLAHRAAADPSELLEMIDRAVTFIGLTEMYPMSFNIISRLLGQNRFPKVHKLASANAGENDVDVDAALRRRIIRNNETDVKLYEHVKSMLVAKRPEWKEILVAEKRTIPEAASQSFPHDDLVSETLRKPKKVRASSASTQKPAADLRVRARQSAPEHEITELERQERARIAGLIHRVRWLEQERTRMRAENLRLLDVSKQIFDPPGPSPESENSFLERVCDRRAEFFSLLRDTIGTNDEFDAYARLVNYDPRRVAAYHQDIAIQNSPTVSKEDKAFAHAIRDLFDPEFYVKANDISDGDVRQPLLHYIVQGRLGGLRPNPLFDRQHYVAQTGKLAENPLLHYCCSGHSRQLNPHPLFDALYYADQCEALGKNTANALFHYQTTGGLLRLNPSPLFDSAYYLSKFEHPDEIEIPLEHYIASRDASAPDPHPLFSADHLRVDRTDASSEGALVFYLKHRALQFERDPHPLFNVRHLMRLGCISPEDSRSPLEQYLAASKDKDIDPHPTFDSAYYRYQLEYERGVKLTVPPIIHYLTVGFKDKALRPHVLFDPAAYLKANRLQTDGPELVRYLSRKDGDGLRCHELFDGRFYDSQREDAAGETGITALEHWAGDGERKLLTDSRLRAPLDPGPLNLAARAVAIAGEFDVDFYRSLYREFAEYDDAAARNHYENYGKREGRHGSARSLLSNVGLPISSVPIGFFPSEYVDLHPDLEVWRDQPSRCLLHYFEHGRAENRQIGYWQLKLDGLHLDIPARESSVIQPPPDIQRRLCILVHIYYPELWPELAAFVRNLGVVSRDVFINVTDTQWTPQLQIQLRELCPEAFVLVSPNRGRDIGGHLRLLEHVDIGRYEAFALMHTKKSGHLAPEKGAAWRQGLIAVFAGREQTAAECLELFREQPRTGIVGAAAWRAHSMNGNQVEVDRLMTRLGIENGNRRLDFVSGTMFLIRSDIVARLHKEFRDTEWQDPAGQDAAFFLDGQLEHAVERVIPSLARQMGYEIVWR